MHLAEALHRLQKDSLEKLAADLMKGTESLPGLSTTIIENQLKSFSTINRIVMACMPPTFSILRALLESETRQVPIETLKQMAVEDAIQIRNEIESEHLLNRGDHLRIYRNVLLEARRSDLTIDASENALLEVLRRELKVSLPEHFLLEYHEHFNAFYISFDQSFDSQLSRLCQQGVLFTFEGVVVLPRDVAPIVADCIGYRLSRSKTMQLYLELTLSDLNWAGDYFKIALTGSKEDRVKRLSDNMIDTVELLNELPGETLKDLCSRFSLPTYGTKSSMVDRIMHVMIVGHNPEPVEEAPPAREDRVLDEQRFFWLFSELKALQMREILESIPHAKRTTGPKELLVHKLWEAHLSEATLLSKLNGEELAEILSAFEQKTSGSKAEKIERIIEYAKNVTESQIAESMPEPPPSEGGAVGPTG